MLMLPLLTHVANGDEYTIADSRDILADQLNLTEDAVSILMTPTKATPLGRSQQRSVGQAKESCAT